MKSFKYLPNFITSLRIIGTACLLFIDPLTTLFYAVYTLSGVSDVLDGFLARKLKVTSELGSKLDSIADLLLYAVMLIKIFPVLLKKLPVKIWIAVGAVLVLRLSSYLVAAVKYHRFASLHTYFNKLTGFSVFLVPYTVELPVFVPFCVVVCVIAGIAALYELRIHINSREYVQHRA